MMSNISGHVNKCHVYNSQRHLLQLSFINILVFLPPPLPYMLSAYISITPLKVLDHSNVN